MAGMFLVSLYFAYCGSYGERQRWYTIMVALSNVSFDYVVAQMIHVWRCSRRYVRIDVILEIVTNSFHITSLSHERHRFIIRCTAYPGSQKTFLKLHLLIITSM